MMDPELKERIIKNSDKGLYIEDYKEFEEALDNRSYRLIDGIYDTIVVDLRPDVPCLQFEETSGEFIGLEELEYTKENGEKI